MRPCLLALALPALLGATVPPAPITVPFDFSRGELAFDATIAGQRVHGLLDTGVDPSVIDIATAERLHLPVRRQAPGEASGEGNDASSPVFPSTIVGLAIGGRASPPVEAAAADLGGLSRDYGQPLQFVLGYSFLQHERVLVDYPAHTLTFLPRSDDAVAPTRGCRTRWAQPLTLLKDLNWPVIAGFRLGTASGPVSLDTGANSGVALYQAALALGDVRARLTATGSVAHGGFRGDATTSAVTFGAPIGFGPFTLPAGQSMTVRHDAGSSTTRIANVGNRVLAAMGLRMLLDYPARRLAFFGDCGPGSRG